ncbi:Tol-Pal system protein TolB [Desulfovibrionales bacterium]
MSRTRVAYLSTLAFCLALGTSLAAVSSLATVQAPEYSFTAFSDPTTSMSSTAFGAPQKMFSADIYGPGRRQVRVALAAPVNFNGTDSSSVSQHLNDQIVHNLSFLPIMTVIPYNAILGGIRISGPTRELIDFRRFQLAGADLVITAGWIDKNVELRVFEAFTTRMIVGKSYKDVANAQVFEIADRFCAALLEALTGHGEFFRSTLAFIRPGGPKGSSALCTVKPTGRDLRILTAVKGYILSPGWSSDARLICYTQIDDRYHQLGIFDRFSGNVKLFKFPGNNIIGPTFTPTGQVAVSLIQGKDPNIYLLDGNYKLSRPLVFNPGINVSADFDRTGGKMVYVSDCTGKPQIYLTDGGEGKRITGGSYDTDPSLAPDGNAVVFARRVADGFRIFFLDLTNGMEQQISGGPGNDETPVFCPDGFFVAYSRGGSKLYLTTRHGDQAVEIPINGAASFPSWGLTERP